MWAIVYPALQHMLKLVVYCSNDHMADKANSLKKWKIEIDLQ